MDQDLFVFRLKQAIIRSGKTQSEVARDAGMVPARITDYLKKRYLPKNDSLLAIANALNVDVDWLAGLDEEERRNEQPTIAVVNNVLGQKTIGIPVIGAIAGGAPLKAYESETGEEEEIPEAWTHGGKEFFALKVSGDSMEPEIPDGTIAIIEKCYEWHNGAVMAVYVNGYNATLKKVKIEPNGILSLIPFNHQHETRIFTPEEVGRVPVRPLGLLVETRKKWAN